MTTEGGEGESLAGRSTGMNRSVVHAGPPFRMVVGVLTALMLSGCVSTPAFSVFARDEEPTDALPATLPAYALEHADPSTARLVGEHNDAELYLVRGEDADSACLVVWPGAEGWVTLCNGTVGVPGVGRFTVRPDGVPAPEGFTQVAENVFVEVG